MLYKSSQAKKFYSGYYVLASICLILTSCQGQNTLVPVLSPKVSASSQPLLPKPIQGFKTQALDTLPMPFDSTRCGSGCQITGNASFTLIDKSTGEISYKSAGNIATLSISATGQVRAHVGTIGGALYAGPSVRANSTGMNFTQLGPETISGNLDTSSVTCNLGTGSYYKWDSSDIYIPIYYFDSGSMKLSYQDNKILLTSSGISSKDMGQWVVPWDASCRSAGSYDNKLIVQGNISITVTLPPRPTPTPTPTPTPPPSEELTLNVSPDVISPENEDDILDSSAFTVHSTVTEPWTLTVAGTKPGPLNQDGIPTPGDSCTWSVIGSGDQTVAFVGKCDDGNWMLDGAYIAKVEAGQLKDFKQIHIDNTEPKISTPVLFSLSDDVLQYSYNIEDPSVNFFASGLDTSSLNVLVRDSNGGTVNASDISFDGSNLFFKTPLSASNSVNVSIKDRVANIGYGNLDGCKKDGAPVALPEDLNRLLAEFNQLKWSQPNVLNELQRINQQLDQIRQQLNQKGFSTQSFRVQGFPDFGIQATKTTTPAASKTANGPDSATQQLVAKQVALLQELAHVRQNLSNQQSSLNAQILQVINEIESYYHYRLHQYTGRFTPLSLEQYKNKFDRAEAIYNRELQSRNSYNLLFAGMIATLESQLYELLLNDLIDGGVAETASNDDMSYAYRYAPIEQSKTAQHLLQLMSNRLAHHQVQMPRLQDKLQHQLEQLLLGNPAVADVDILASEPQDEFSVASVSDAPHSGGFTILRKGAVGPAEIDAPTSLPLGPGIESFPGGGGILPGGTPFTSPLWKPGLGGTLFAAWEVATEDIKQKFVDLFHQACRILPNPFPSPSLFPTPTPTPPHEDNCKEFAIPVSDLIQEGTLQPGKNPKITTRTITLLVLMDADFEKAKSDFRRLIGPDCEPEKKGRPPNELDFVQLSDGTKIILRDFSSGDKPTIEIQYPENPDGPQNITKFRYNP